MRLGKLNQKRCPRGRKRKTETATLRRSKRHHQPSISSTVDSDHEQENELELPSLAWDSGEAQVGNAVVENLEKRPSSVIEIQEAEEDIAEVVDENSAEVADEEDTTELADGEDTELADEEDTAEAAEKGAALTQRDLHATSNTEAAVIASFVEDADPLDTIQMPQGIFWEDVESYSPGDIMSFVDIDEVLNDLPDLDSTLRERMGSVSTRSIDSSQDSQLENARLYLETWASTILSKSYDKKRFEFYLAYTCTVE